MENDLARNIAHNTTDSAAHNKGLHIARNIAHNTSDNITNIAGYVSQNLAHSLAHIIAHNITPY